MEKVSKMSFVPEQIMEKVRRIIGNLRSPAKNETKWRTVTSLHGSYSRKLSSNYRLLLTSDGRCFVGNHDSYIRRIQILKGA